MATKKISELTPLDPSANLQLTFIPVFDDATDTTRKITLQQINDAIEASIPIAESAYNQANTATTNAATADQKALSAGNYANSAFVRANNSLNVSVGGTITGDITINGNVTVSGCTASFQVSTLRTNDPILDLSFGTTGNPTQNAGIRILRGDELPVQVRWNEESDRWQFTNDGVTYTNFGDIVGIDSNFINASFQTANTGNLTAHLAFDNSNSVYNLANLNAQLSVANFNAINAHSNGTGTIVTNSITANTITFGGSLYANAAYDAANVADQRAVTSGDYANSAYAVANSALTSNDYANAAFSSANVADQRAVTSGDYANSSYIHANAVFNLANTFTSEAATAGVYANAAFDIANSASSYANGAYTSQNTTGLYANTGYEHANASYISQNTTGVYSNTAYEHANASYVSQNTTGLYANTAYGHANASYVEANSASSGVIIADQKAVTAGSYANSAYLLANVADQRAVTSGSYANSAFGVANSALTSTITTDVSMTGILRLEQVHEQFQSKADATGTVEHDCSFGHIFYHISPDANWTANFTNLNLSNTYATAVTLIIVQGGTGYYPNAVQIGGVNQTINWQGNATPTPSTNRTDVVTFSILNTGSGYVVFGQLTGF